MNFITTRVAAEIARHFVTVGGVEVLLALSSRAVDRRQVARLFDVWWALAVVMNACNDVFQTGVLIRCAAVDRFDVACAQKAFGISETLRSFLQTNSLTGSIKPTRAKTRIPEADVDSVCASIDEAHHLISSFCSIKEKARKRLTLSLENSC